MAERRMFAKSIVLSDAFLDMPMSARCLYFTLGMLADDDGFIGNPKSIMRQCGSTEDDMKILLLKRYVLGFDSGIIVIKHWRMNNYLQNDRHKPTTYLEELSTLKVEKNGAYTECIQNVSKLDTQVSIDKLSKGKDNNKPPAHKYGEYQNVLLTDEQMEKLKNEFPNDWQQRIEKVSTYCKSHGRKYSDYLATIRNWAREDKKKNNPKEDYLPTYSTKNNERMSKEEEEELLKLMNK